MNIPVITSPKPRQELPTSVLSSYKRNFKESSKLAAEFLSNKKSELPQLRNIQKLNTNEDLSD